MLSALHEQDIAAPEIRLLGASGLRVPSLILGSGPLASMDEDETRDVVEAYIKAGGFALEIAQEAGLGTLKTLAQLLIEYADADLVTFARTGVGGRTFEGGVIDSSRRNLAKTLDETLALLDREHVDVWVLDGLDGVTSSSEVAGTLEWAVSSGRAGNVAVSGVAAWQAVDLDHELGSRGLRLSAHVLPYSLLERGGEHDGIPAARARSYGVLGASPLAGGALTGKYRHGTPANSRRAGQSRSVPEHYFGQDSRAVIESLSTAAEGLGVHSSELAMAWALGRTNVDALIIGARTSAQVKVALRASSLNVPREITEVLDEVSGRLIRQ